MPGFIGIFVNILVCAIISFISGSKGSKLFGSDVIFWISGASTSVGEVS